MQHQQDKDFDSRIKGKMADFSKTPPPGLWEFIDEELNGPAASRTNWLIPGATWLMIAASVCLLAAAGVWLYRYQPFPEGNSVAVIGGKDSTSSPRPGVIILNKSRSRDEAKRETGDPEGTTKQPGATKQPDATGQSAPAKQPGALPQQTEPSRSEKKTSSPAEEKTGTRPERIEPSSSSEPVMAAAQLQNEREQVSGQHRLNGQNQVNEQSQTPLEERIIPVDELGKRSVAAVESSVKDPELNPLNPEGLSASGRGITDAAVERNSIVPQEIREVSGIGDALNLVASTIDRSEDKFIRVKRDEESGKWDGIRLNLGILTISYNKPDKKNKQQRN